MWQEVLLKYQRYPLRSGRWKVPVQSVWAQNRPKSGHFSTRNAIFLESSWHYPECPDQSKLQFIASLNSQDITATKIAATFNVTITCCHGGWFHATGPKNHEFSRFLTEVQVAGPVLSNRVLHSAALCLYPHQKIIFRCFCMSRLKNWCILHGRYGPGTLLWSRQDVVFSPADLQHPIGCPGDIPMAVNASVLDICLYKSSI